MGLCLYVGNRNYSSWSMRPGVLLPAYDIPFEEKLIRFDSFAKDSEFKQTARALSPTGNVPILVDDDVQNRRGESLVINDTLSIFEYIAEKFTDLHCGQTILLCAHRRATFAPKCIVVSMHCVITAV